MTMLLRGEPRGPTAHQYEILVSVVRNGSYKLAAQECGIALSTVKEHLAILREHWGAETTPHLVALVMMHVGDMFDDVGPSAMR